jgi:tripartite-type tricarboxylate transporter receptor subunit TctC
MNTTKGLLAAALLALAATAGAQGSSGGQGAEDYPSKTIRFVVPFPPGGSTDVLARRIASSWHESMGQPVVVENRAGAGGAIGSDLVAKAPPDGHTVLIGVTGSHGVSVSLNPSLPYHPLRDFEPISRVVTTPLVIVTRPDFPAKDLAGFVAYAKANPGKMTHASPGNGTSMHLTGEMFNLAAGTSIVHVGYRGSAAAMTDLMGGQVTSMFTDVLVAMPFIQSGKVRPFAVTSARRHPMLPDVPTVAESGYPGFEALSWQGLFVPKGTPRAIVEKLNAQTRKALASPEIRDFFSGQGMEVQATSPEEFRAFIEKEIPKWARIIKEAKVTLQ